MPLAAGTRLGVFEILAPLGKGGMGEVYRAKDTKLEREVAVKILPEEMAKRPERMARFKREAKLLAARDHPHIAAIHGLHEEDGQHFLVMELVDGETLADRLKWGPLPVREALEVGRQIAEALEAAHEKDIIHRDLKPSNVMLTSKGKPKFLDFGLGRVLAKGVLASGVNTETTPDETGTGVVMGTAPYMSPEQARGDEVDHRTDIWSLGCVLYETLAGRRAFPGRTTSDTIVAVLARQPDWEALPEATPALVGSSLRRCVKKDQSKRLHDIADARIEIEEMIEAGGDLGPAGSPSTPASFWQRALPWAFAGTLAALALALWAPWHQPSAPPFLRYDARLSPDVSLGREALLQGPAAVLSPSGDLLAFVGQEGDGPSRIYTRRLDHLEASPLSGTEGAHSPFFSPDGNWIAFFADRKLQKVSVSGGAAITLCDAIDERGGTWRSDGAILFMPESRPGVGLSRVSAEGGACEPFTKPDPDAGEVTHRWPQWLPGGDAVLYTAHSTTGNYDDASLVIEAVPDGPRKVVYRGGYHGRYLPSGHLVFVHQGTLFAAPFDLGTLETTGAAVPAVEGLRVSPNTAGTQFAFSEDGAFVYVAGEALPVAPIHWLSRDGTTTLLRPKPANWGNLRFSPAGDRLGIVINDGKNYDVWVYDWVRDTLSRLTFDPAFDAVPVWTPDSRRIVFSSSRSGQINLYWRRSDGSGEVQRLTQSENGQWAASWHPSGRLLAFHERRPDTGGDLMMLEVEGDEETGWKPGTPTVFLSTPFNEWTPMFSADGRWVAYGSDESGQPEVYVRPFPGPGGRWQVSTGGEVGARWSRTRPERFYGTPGGEIIVVPYTVEVDSFQPGKPTRWSDAAFVTRPAASGHFDLHPDGQRVALQSASETPVAEVPDTVVFITNFFDELRRLTEAEGR